MDKPSCMRYINCRQALRQSGHRQMGILVSRSLDARNRMSTERKSCADCMCIVLALSVIQDSIPTILDKCIENGSNSWAYTRLGKMNIPESDVTELLSNGDITLKIAIEK